MIDRIIVMLTHNDVTVGNAKEIFESAGDLPVKNWGFKDVGLPAAEMQELCALMKERGKTTFLEVVTYTEEACMRGARVAAECGFDHLMGTIFYPAVNDFIRTAKLKYMPFVGDVSGSPSVLRGTAEGMLAQEAAYKAAGVFGTDLLGYRYAEGDPEQLAADFISRARLPCVLAGSIDSEKRLDIVEKLAPWGFTMGSALFNKRFVPGGTFRENLEHVVRYLSKKERI
ncbi:MAG: hypothetical protein LBU21_00420 [Treponema sp.]|jgi:hypothetical protein|nr:hypothetical protein [Treponema sp.]